MTKVGSPLGGLSAEGGPTIVRQLERMKLRPADQRFVKPVNWPVNWQLTGRLTGRLTGQRVRFTYLRGADQKLT
jgi:hypothetical protein